MSNIVSKDGAPLAAGDKVADILNTLRRESSANLMAAVKELRFAEATITRYEVRGILAGLVVLLKELDETRREGDYEG